MLPLYAVEIEALASPKALTVASLYRGFSCTNGIQQHPVTCIETNIVQAKAAAQVIDLIRNMRDSSYGFSIEVFRLFASYQQLR